MTTNHMSTSLDHLSGLLDELEGSVLSEDKMRLVEMMWELVNLAKSLASDNAAIRAQLPSEQIVEDIEELGGMAAEMSLDYRAAWGRVQAWLESLERGEA